MLVSGGHQLAAGWTAVTPYDLSQRDKSAFESYIVILHLFSKILLTNKIL